jgi:hypothetical protein
MWMIQVYCILLIFIPAYSLRFPKLCHTYADATLFLVVSDHHEFKTIAIAEKDVSHSSTEY